MLREPTRGGFTLRTSHSHESMQWETESGSSDISGVSPRNGSAPRLGQWSGPERKMRQRFTRGHSPITLGGPDATAFAHGSHHTTRYYENHMADPEEAYL